jgi:cell division protein FtsQ
MWDDARQLNAVSLAIFIAATISLAWAALGWLVRQPAFAFREVVITTPLIHASGAHLESVVREELAGTFFTLNLDRAGHALTQVPWVRSVGLRRQWPRRLEIDVVEHEPFARWNDTALVDARGDVFSADWDGDLPQFSGPDGQAPTVMARYREWSAMLAPLGLSVQTLTLSPRGGWEIGAIRAVGPPQGANYPRSGGSAAASLATEAASVGVHVRAVGPSKGANYSSSGGSAGASLATEVAGAGAHVLSQGSLTIELGRDDPSARLARFVAAHDRTIGALTRAGRHIEQVDLRYRNGFAVRVPGFREKPVRKS